MIQAALRRGRTTAQHLPKRRGLQTLRVHQTPVPVPPIYPHQHATPQAHRSARLTPPLSPAPVPPPRKFGCSAPCSAAAPTSTPCAGTAKRRREAATARSAPTNGSPACVRKGVYLAPNARTACCARWMTQPSTVTWPGEMHRGGMLSVCTPCCRTRPAICWRWTSMTPTGRTVPALLRAFAVRTVSRSRWNAPAPARAPMSGCFLPKPPPAPRRASSATHC